MAGNDNNTNWSVPFNVGDRRKPKVDSITKPVSMEAGKDINLTITTSDDYLINRVNLTWVVNDVDTYTNIWYPQNITDTRLVNIGNYSANTTIVYWAYVYDHYNNENLGLGLIEDGEIKA